MDANRKTGLLASIGICAAVVCCISCIALAVSVVSDNEVLQSVCFGTVMLSLVVMAVAFVALLFLRQWLPAFAVLAGVGASLVVGFLAMILIGAGQHHPPRQDQEALADIAWGDFYIDGQDERCQLLAADVETGSWWTDGMTYYKAAKAGNTIRLEGMTLHEGGMVTALQLQDDTLRVVLPREGYTTFAHEGCWVSHHLLTDDDDETLKTEVLVAYEPGGSDPIAVLQRFDGNELAYERDAIWHALEGTYREWEGQQQWTFLPDGTCRLLADADNDDVGEASHYTIVQWYDQLTNILRLPDGRQVGVLLDENFLKVFEATYDADADEWEQKDAPSLYLQRTDAPDSWLMHRLFTPAAATVLSVRQVEGQLRQLSGYDIPVAALNAYLMKQWLEEAARNLVEEEDGQETE